MKGSNRNVAWEDFDLIKHEKSVYYSFSCDPWIGDGGLWRFARRE